MINGGVEVGDTNVRIFTAKDGSWDVMLEPYKIGRLTLKKVGTIEYSCRFQPYMKGRFSVTN
jgi:hypothetical protein